ncbi:unnamed protein product [Mycetohabitans rhizoxinica HKI 454]|uniref:Uncharacterized protein n=1 Tax=Mycetohabitans rhizoxinica (strain DSM 19002 / CIP 109453 / HKI 454) TaxID=882378 RepID=E5ANZ9_MYCRK|nr:unnamed protein product [Mycetohabitans rhizoxinica HKI 454]
MHAQASCDNGSGRATCMTPAYRRAMVAHVYL